MTRHILDVSLMNEWMDGYLRIVISAGMRVCARAHVCVCVCVCVRVCVSQHMVVIIYERLRMAYGQQRDI